MRHQWYADHRDVVKWGALVSLAREANAHTIVQVAYARDDEVNAVLEVDGRGTVPVPAEVWDHFRNFERIRPLGETLELEISILGAAFHQGRRTQYRDACIAELEKLPRRPAVVLLDPDTGLAPTATAKAKHVTPEDVRAFWNALRPREWLVVYQHAHQRKAHEQRGRRRAASSSTAGLFRNRSSAIARHSRATWRSSPRAERRLDSS